MITFSITPTKFVKGTAFSQLPVPVKERAAFTTVTVPVKSFESMIPALTEQFRYVS